MNTFRSIGILFLACFFLTSCFEDNDDNIQFSELEVKDFIWKGMNVVYLYKSDVPDLADTRFSTDQEYNDYLNGFDSPQSLFDDLIFDPTFTDRFSRLEEDYIALEEALQGTSMSNGLRFFAFENPANASELILAVNFVARGSVAEAANIKRGDFFNQIDGTTITGSNIALLLGSTTYTLGYADYNDNGTPETTDDSFTSSGNSVELTKVIFTENPVNTSTIIDVDGENVGYLLYKAFRPNFVNELNAVFGDFAANNVQHLVLDLRYNGGGSVATAAALGSMIAGESSTNVFSKLFYNETLQSNNTNFNFRNDVNTLNLDKVYILTTNQTASASELVINSLRPYIDVVQIGTTTVGKTQASITIYDSPNLERENANPNHTYAMQPLVANSSNVNDELVPLTGIVPDNSFIVEENVFNLGTFGDVNEPMLARAIQDIEGTGRLGQIIAPVRIVSKHGSIPLEQEMFITPEDLNGN